MAAYYNEIEPYAAQWLRNLIAAGHIASGEVDERSIREVSSKDVKGFDQVHFFAGIGVWSYALRLADWGDDQPVWTGSCPCQPFSTAGKQLGNDDERHLWPEFYRLIQECKPSIVFGEQVASALGRNWLGDVRTDLEALGYAVGAADLGAASVGAPHIRQRLWWVADTVGKRQAGQRLLLRPEEARRQSSGVLETAGGGKTCDKRLGSLYGFWKDADWLLCQDGKWRSVEPGTFPLAHGAASRVGRLCAYGNAIVPQVAATFIKAVMDCRP